MDTQDTKYLPFEENPKNKQKNKPQDQGIKLSGTIRHIILAIFALVLCISGISRNVLQRIFQFSDSRLFNQLHIVYYLGMPLGALFFQYIYTKNEKILLVFSYLMVALSVLPLIYDFKYSYCAYTSFGLKGFSEGIYFTFGSIWIEKFAKRGFKFFCLCIFFLGKNLGNLFSEVLFTKIRVLELNKNYFLIEFSFYIIVSLIILYIDPIYFSDKLDCVNYKNVLYLRPSNSPSIGGEESIKDCRVSVFKPREDSRDVKEFTEKERILLTDQLNFWLIGFMFVGYFILMLFNEWLNFQFNLTHKLKNIFTFMHLIEVAGIFISLLYFLFIFKSSSTAYSMITFLTTSFIILCVLISTLFFQNNSLVVNILAIIFFACDYICIPIATILCISMVSKSLRANSLGTTNSLAYMSFAFVFIINYYFGQSLIFEKSLYFCIGSAIFGYICTVMTYRKFNKKQKEKRLFQEKPKSDTEKHPKGYSDLELVVDEGEDKIDEI